MLLTLVTFENALITLKEIAEVVESKKYVPTKSRRVLLPRDAELVGVAHFILKVMVGAGVLSISCASPCPNASISPTRRR